MTHSAVSLLRVTTAIAITLPLSVVFGVLCENNSIADRILRFLMPIPKIAFLPFIMLIFGIGELSKLTFLLFFTVFPLTDAVKNAFDKKDNDTLFLFKMQGASPMFLFWQLRLPAVLPTILSAVGSCFSGAFAVLLLAEGYGTNLGLGFFLVDSFLKFNYKNTFLAVVASSLLGCICPLLSKFAIKHLCPWK